jgi:hypothetical protein
VRSVPHTHHSNIPPCYCHHSIASPVRALPLYAAETTSTSAVPQRAKEGHGERLGDTHRKLERLPLRVVRCAAPTGEHSRARHIRVTRRPTPCATQVVRADTPVCRMPLAPSPTQPVVLACGELALQQGGSRRALPRPRSGSRLALQ